MSSTIECNIDELPDNFTEIFGYMQNRFGHKPKTEDLDIEVKHILGLIVSKFSNRGIIHYEHKEDLYKFLVSIISFE